jgi:hypothetical protein
MLRVKKDHIFADFGHGIGNACLQASYSIGCETKGIELVSARYFVSEALNRALDKATRVESLSNVSTPGALFKASLDGDAHRLMHHLFLQQLKPEMMNFAAGRVGLKHGRIEDPKHRDWLTDVDAVFVNNFNEVFGRRSTYATKRTIDDYIAALFAKMKPGSAMVTMEPIYSLDQTQNEANAARRRHKLAESSDASFYEVEELELGLACESVSWSEGEATGAHEQLLYVHKYTRLAQEHSDEGAVFLCTNPTCGHAKNAIPIPACIEDEKGLLVLNYCPGCKSSGRRKKRKNAPKLPYSPGR